MFLDLGTKNLHIAEMAHILAASDAGPRANPILTASERGAYENLILLCPKCHTIVDKAPTEHPDDLIRDWKRQHKDRIAQAFGAILYPNRHAVRRAIEPILAENKAIFDGHNPDLDYRLDPESELADVWKRKVLAQILPNNRKLVTILNQNRDYLTEPERELYEQFKQHVDDLEHRHIGDGSRPIGSRFPVGMSTLLEGS